MATDRELPYGNARFQVEIDGIAEKNFGVVQLPEMFVDHPEFREGAEPRPQAQVLIGRTHFGTLLLKRGYRGSLDLYRWWQAASTNAPDARRLVTVSLLSEHELAVVTVWKIKDAFPIRYGFPPLDGLDGGPLTEIIEIACGSVEMI